MSIKRNATYNIVGFLVPTVLGLATVPAYLKLVGVERFGVLSLAWVVLGYFGLFDLGLGRATAQRIASLRDAQPEEREIALDTALATNVGIGVIGSAVLWPVAWYMFARGFDLSPALRAEALAAVPFLALAVPVATTIGVLSGALMAREHFFTTNRISITSTILFQVFPLLVAYLFGPNLSLVLATSISARLIGVLMLWLACRREFGPVNGRRWDRRQLRALLAYGGWITVTALFGPLLVFSDRFFIGSTMGAVAVTIYTVPIDITKRLGGVAGALSNALFPRLALATGAEARRLIGGAVGSLYALLTPPVAAALMLMDPVMRLWLGDQVGGHAAPLARILLVAAWFNTFAQIAYTRLQAQGRPDIVSKALLAQTPFYLTALWFSLKVYGLWGAASVYLLRVVVDTLMLFYFAARRIEHGLVLIPTLCALTAAGWWLREQGGFPLVAGIVWGVVAGGLFIVPAWFLSPAQLRAQGLGILRRSLARAFKKEVAR